MNLLAKALNDIPAVLRQYADAYTLPESDTHLALQDAADALDDALDLIVEEEGE